MSDMFVIDRVVPADELQNCMISILEKVGLSRKHAEMGADIPFSASLRGVDTHGVRIFPNHVRGLMAGKRSVHADIKPIRQLGSIELWDGDGGLATVCGAVAMERAIELAETQGMGWVVIRGSSHNGASGSYAMQAVRKGFVGISITNSGPSMTVAGSVSRTVGNNPLGIGAPAPEFPYLLDIAMSVAAGMKVIMYNKEGLELPEGWIVPDRPEGSQWVLLPAGGPKGSGLAIAMEILTGVMSGGAILGELAGGHCTGDDWTQTMIAVNPAALQPIEEYNASMSKMYAEIKSAERAPGVDEILIPGERAWRETQKRLREGVPLEKNTVVDLANLADELGVPCSWKV